MEKGIIDNENQIYDYIDNLKKTRKRLLTNFFLEPAKLEYAIKNHELFFEYEDGAYFNLLYADDGFYRLYYYIADLSNYFFQGNGATTVCDVFSENEDGELVKIKDKLCRYDFFSYAVIHKWTMDSPESFRAKPTGQYIFKVEKEPEVINTLFHIFDSYTDYLPRRHERENFLKNKQFFNMYTAEGKKLAGSVVFTEKGRLFTTEFYFVMPQEREKKASYIMLDHYYQTYAKKKNQFVSWIHEKNLPSIAVHNRYHYQREKLTKYTFLKRERESFCPKSLCT